MRRQFVMCAVALSLLAVLAEAGGGQALPVPTLGEAGVITLALGLVSAGIATLRRGRKR